MVKRIRQTQIASLKKTKVNIKSKRQTVYGAIKTTIPATNRMIAKALGWDINRVTGRVTELVNQGKVIANGTHYDNQTNRTVTLWEAL